MITDKDREVARQVQQEWLDGPKHLRELVAEVIADVRREAYAQACGDCAGLCRQPYSDLVQCSGPDEPMAVGEKLAAACLALGKRGPQ